MNLRVRLAATFALVALLTGLAVALAAPTIVGRGFARLQEGETPGNGPGAGFGQGPAAGGMAGAGAHAQQVQRDMVQTIVVVALVAAAGASVLGFVIAGRIAAPLRHLESAAGALAAGDLARRSGVGSRRDEIGSLGRTFDAMAADLQAADASRRRFFQDAAHELKTPLAVIDATATAVLEGVYEHDDTHLATIREQSRILAGIVDALRTISLAEAGALPMRREAVVVADLVADVVRAFGAQAELAGLTLAVGDGAGDGAGDPAGLAVVADPDRLRQILAAYVDNAIRHTPRGGRVTLEVERRGTRVRIAVADTGPGIPAEAAGHVFDRFFRLDEARDRSTGASGLGLAIAKALAEALGGRVGVDAATGAGSRFWVELEAATR